VDWIQLAHDKVQSLVRVEMSSVKEGNSLSS
jgi:hypothetical protein